MVWLATPGMPLLLTLLCGMSAHAAGLRRPARLGGRGRPPPHSPPRTWLLPAGKRSALAQEGFGRCDLVAAASISLTDITEARKNVGARGGPPTEPSLAARNARGQLYLLFSIPSSISPILSRESGRGRSCGHSSRRRASKVCARLALAHADMLGQPKSRTNGREP
jgi:hypothetical protein